MTAARLVASGLGTGFLPRAPGTWGSLAALAVGAALLAWSPWALPVAVVVAVAAGLWAIARAGGEADPGWVVIDEVAGMWLTMVPLQHPRPLGLAAAFVLFRLLDITKPGPIGWMDRQKAAWGVMGDDVVAGAIGAVILWAVFGYIVR